jgi:trehalose synthase
MDDYEENAAMVNALQRHTAVIVQKSLREGFGLTVTEAMWKRRPVVASAVGGIQDQLRDGIDGLLVQQPADADEFARVVGRVLADAALAARLGDSGYARVRDNYLSIDSLEHWADLVESLFLQRAPGTMLSTSP